MMAIGMSDPIPVNECSQSFIGRMQGTVVIIGDIVASLNVAWEADSESSADVTEEHSRK